MTNKDNAEVELDKLFKILHIEMGGLPIDKEAPAQKSYYLGCEHMDYDIEQESQHLTNYDQEVKKATILIKKLLADSYSKGKVAGKHEQRHQALGVGRWIAVGDEHGYWEHPMTVKRKLSPYPYLKEQ